MIDFDNLDDPLIPYPKIFNIPIENQVAKKVNIYLRPSEISTIKNPFYYFSKSVIQSALIYESISSESKNFDKADYSIDFNL